MIPSHQVEKCPLSSFKAAKGATQIKVKKILSNQGGKNEGTRSRNTEILSLPPSVSTCRNHEKKRKGPKRRLSLLKSSEAKPKAR
jgi:hypothetical protein